MGILRICFTLAMTALILYGCWFFTRFAATRIQAGYGKPGGRLQVMDRVALASDKSLAIVRAGGRYLLIGVAPSQISVLAELTKEDVEQPGEEGTPVGTGGGFESLLQQALEKYRGKKGGL